MIIGNNNTNNNFSNNNLQKFTTNFDKKFKPKEKANNKPPMMVGKKSTDFFSITNKNDMADKTYAMLQERYNNGLITLDEFTKKCQQLNKKRKNN